MLTIIDPHIDDERYMCIFYICQLNLISVSWYIDLVYFLKNISHKQFSEGRRDIDLSLTYVEYTHVPFIINVWINDGEHRLYNRELVIEKPQNNQFKEKTKHIQLDWMKIKFYTSS
jgi:hypothetical protein